MFVFLNHTSFLLLWLLVWGLAAVYILRGKNKPRRLETLAVITAALAVLYFALIPKDVTSGELVELEGMIGRGDPVLIQFKSPH